MRRAIGKESIRGTSVTAPAKPSSGERASRSLLKPVPSVDLVREVVLQLRTQIIAGSFDADGKLPPEGQLGQVLGVSRTVIREAMRILAAQGMVEVSRGRLPRIKPVDSQNVVDAFHTYLERSDHSLLDLIEVRRPLEAAIAALAAERATADQIQAMEESIQQLASSRQIRRQVEADLEFHNLLAESTANSVFQLLMKTLAGLMRRSRQKTLAKAGVARSISGHGAVLAAVQLHDPEAARQAMLDHLAEAECDLQEKE
jgi:GntR family transcriptional repressor for pyruvate dehydrogenase complex